MLLASTVLITHARAQKLVHTSDTFLVRAAENFVFRYKDPGGGITKERLDTAEIQKVRSNLRVLHYYTGKPFDMKDMLYIEPVQRCNNYQGIKNKEHAGSPFFITKDRFPGERFAGTALPNSLRFYLDTACVRTEKYQLVTDSIRTATLESYLQPFYFKKFEVTNGEYLEFVRYVTDSIARRFLGEPYVKKNGQLDHTVKIDWENDDIHEKLQPLYVPEGKRFYNRREINTDTLFYAVAGGNSELAANGYKTIRIYPDTLSWINDFTYSFNEPMTNMYFWHPAFADYPVVGISYWQTLAFLDWKTRTENQKLKAQGSKVVVTYDLPTELEWEMVAAAGEHATIYPNDFSFTTDESWLTDLMLIGKEYSITEKEAEPFKTDSGGTDRIISPSTYVLQSRVKKATVTRENFLSGQLRSQYRYKGTYIMDGSFHTEKSDLSAFTKKTWAKKELQHINLDPNGISFMAGNVSEWMKETYKDNWAPVFAKRQLLLASAKGKDAELEARIEQYYDSFNDKNGHLVRGSNWFDERYSYRLGKNTTGLAAKRFVDPKKQHATIGFRYVIHVSLSG